MFGGLVIDRYTGVAWGALIFSTLVLLGQAVFWFSSVQVSFPLAIAGRVLFGLGGECLGVAQSAFTAKFFKGNELAFAFGIALSFSRIGSAVNLDIEPRLVLLVFFNSFFFLYFDLYFGLYFGLFFWFVFLVCFFLHIGLYPFVVNFHFDAIQFFFEEHILILKFFSF